jgi:hypothetical protein
MRKTIFMLVLVAAVALPATAFAHPAPRAVDVHHAIKDCSSLRATMRLHLGPRVFRQTYGTRAHARGNAFGRCVARWARTERANRLAAIATCAAEYTADPAAFMAKYGTFRACVNANRRALARAERHATLNAARSCRAQRADPGFAAAHESRTFAAFYGTNANDANAFGKCVSMLARAKHSTGGT